MDPDYVVQGLYFDSTLSREDGSDNEDEAVTIAKTMVKDPTFEGDYVRIITRDGELVWDSRAEGFKKCG